MQAHLKFTFAALSVAALHAQTLTETVIHNFSSPPKGGIPYGTLTRDAAGNLYGTTEQGGAANAGVVYKLTPAGKLTLLYTFSGGADGKEPEGGVIRDSSGNLYGTTYSGGAGFGVVFKLSPAGQETVLYSFKGGADGSNPKAGVVRDSSGNLYGTASSGGTSHGVVFKLSATGTETVLYTFKGQSDGSSPLAVIRDSAGNLYGTASGGSAFSGVVFKVDTTNTQTVLYTFQGESDGDAPNSGLVMDSAGDLYGTTNEGGSSFSGVVFRVTQSSGFSVLHPFSGGTDGAYPEAGLAMDSEGNLYGATSGGGNKTGFAGSGVLFKLGPTNQETVLYTFQGGTTGGGPNTSVILDSSGNVYGTATAGNALLGVVYKVDTTGTETVLYGFAGAVDGNNPQTPLIRDAAGNLYGTTFMGGPSNRGVVFKITAAGTEKVLYAFKGGSDGGYPEGGLVRDSAGNLYGAAEAGGTFNAGVIYKLTAAGVETVLYNFTGGTDGGEPVGSLVRDASGNLYGVAEHGGATNCFSGCGVVFKLSTAGVETVLLTFNGTNGAYPIWGVIRDSAGNLYGVTSGGGLNFGVVYQLDTSDHQTLLYQFKGGADGDLPQSGLVRDSAGNLYGTTEGGGSSFAGVVYKVTAAGVESVLYNFTGTTDGGLPVGTLIRDAEGNLYGAMQFSSGNGAGGIFELSSTGTQTVLHNFTGGADGGRPYAGVIEDSAGNFYGAASSGGSELSGVVFKLTP